MLTSRNNYGKM